MTDPKIDIVSKVVPCWVCRGGGITEHHRPVIATKPYVAVEHRLCETCAGTGLVRVEANFADVPTVRRGIE